MPPGTIGDKTMYLNYEFRLEYAQDLPQPRFLSGGLAKAPSAEGRWAADGRHGRKHDGRIPIRAVRRTVILIARSSNVGWCRALGEAHQIRMPGGLEIPIDRVRRKSTDVTRTPASAKDILIWWASPKARHHPTFRIREARRGFQAPRLVTVSRIFCSRDWSQLPSHPRRDDRRRRPATQPPGSGAGRPALLRPRP